MLQPDACMYKAGGGHAEWSAGGDSVFKVVVDGECVRGRPEGVLASLSPSQRSTSRPLVFISATHASSTCRSRAMSSICGAIAHLELYTRAALLKNSADYQHNRWALGAADKDSRFDGQPSSSVEQVCVGQTCDSIIAKGTKAHRHLEVGAALAQLRLRLQQLLRLG